jgi:hypothetical protein
MKRETIGISIVLMVVLSSSVFANKSLTLEERVKAQEAIERVYYSHRIWPKENPQPKPPFEKMVTKEQIEAKVTDYLKKSAALGQFWQRPIQPDQLQAEIDRMAKGTKDQGTLNELFKALNDDPYLIAECLARSVLADRLIRNWYANDGRFHGETRRKAEEALKNLTTENFCEFTEGQYGKMKYKLETQGEKEESAPPNLEDNSISISEKEFVNMLAEIPDVGNISQIIEKNDCFIIVHTILKNEAEIETESLSFAKEDLGEWLKKQGLSAQLSDAESGSYSLYLPPMPEAGCTEGWDNRSLDDVPDGRSGHTAVWTGTEMIVWGGNNGDLLSTGGRYHPSTDTWVPTPTGTGCPTARSGHTVVWTGSEMIMWGGSGQTGGRYSPSTNTWTATSTGANCPTARGGHTAVWIGTEMIIWGGYDGSNCLSTGGKYNPSTDTWIPTSTGMDCPTERTGPTAVWTGFEMIIWGGYSVATGYLNTGGCYNPSADTWIAMSTGTSCPAAREEHTAVWTGARMIVWGGWGNTGYLNTGGRYNPSTNTWLSTSLSNVPTERRWHTAVWAGTEMIIWGGMRVSGHLNTGGRYNPSNDSWIQTSTGPSARSYHSAIWTGTEMIIWGGQILNSGGRYNPSTDSWIPTSRGNAPSPKGQHTAIWTGTEMIVWGSGNTGGRYNPPTDSWTPTSFGENVPSVRWSHSAVWTGTEMIIWGGTNSNHDLFNDGGRYNPLTDSWMPISTGENVPIARDLHTAVWTGTEMIIWGGNPSNGLNTGGKYNPSTDTWIPTSIGENVPTPRYSHTAVWTGNEMIIWGGGGYYQYQRNDGGRYNPSNDSWIPTSTGENVPLGRSSHTAIWTGTEMIIWGGEYGGNTGGRYNPETDTWIPTSTGENVPSSRYRQTAVWTGREMIIWGGVYYMNTGGSYCPKTDSWLPTSTDEYVPCERAYHTSVWTGSVMIIWGGTNNSAYFNSGGIYYLNPASPVFFNDIARDSSACTDSGVLIDWAPSYWGDGGSGTRTFDVLRDGSTIATGLSESALSYIDTTGDNEVIYLYQIRANNGCGLSTTTAGTTARDMASPSSPRIFTTNTATDISWCIDSGVFVSWTAPTDWGDCCAGTRTYDILRDGMPIASGLSESTLVYTDNTGESGVSYLYQVRASNTCGLSTTTGGAFAADMGNSVSPQGFTTNTATDISECADSGVLVSWTAPTDWGDDGSRPRSFDVLCKGITIAGGLSTSTLSYIHTAGVNGTYYLYQVKANNGCGLSATTDGVLAADNGLAPMGFSNNLAGDISDCTDFGVLIEWNVPSNWGDGGSGTRTFDILRDSIPIAAGLSESTLSYVDITGDNGVSYLYKVRANNGCGFSKTTAGITAGDNTATTPTFSNNQAGDFSFCLDTGVLISWTQPADWGYGGGEGRTFDVLRNGTVIASFYYSFTTSYTDTTGQNGVAYLYQVRANNDCGLSTTTAGATAADGVDGAPPQGFASNSANDSSTCADSGVLVSWTAPSDWGDCGPGTRTYSVLRDEIPIATGLSASTLSYTDTTGVNGTYYTYQVRATNGCGLSATTEGAYTADYASVYPAIANNTAGAIGCVVFGVLVEWRPPSGWGDNGNGTRTFDVLRDSTPIATGLSETASSYTDSGGDPEVIYFYQIRANNGCALSMTTTGASASATGSMFLIIANNSASDIGCADTGVSVSWTPPSGWQDFGGTRTFDVLRDGAPNATGLPETTLSYTDNTGDNGVSYLYQVRANNSCGFSATTVGMSVADNVSFVPDQVTFIDFCSWDPVSGADGYKLYRGTYADLPNLMNLNSDGCVRYDGTSTSYNCAAEDPSAVSGRFYWYLVTAYDDNCEGTAGEGTGFIRNLSSFVSCP